jgi:hypothetical protein
MSELSIDELQAETGELLPERETLGTIIIGNVGNATAIQNHSDRSFNIAINDQSVDVVGSFNHHHTFILMPGGGLL